MNPSVLLYSLQKVTYYFQRLSRILLLELFAFTCIIPSYSNYSSLYKSNRIFRICSNYSFFTNKIKYSIFSITDLLELFGLIKNVGPCSSYSIIFVQFDDKCGYRNMLHRRLFFKNQTNQNFFFCMQCLSLLAQADDIH